MFGSSCNRTILEPVYMVMAKINVSIFMCSQFYFLISGPPVRSLGNVEAILSADFGNNVNKIHLDIGVMPV
jgi:hypothetical protein